MKMVIMADSHNIAESVEKILKTEKADTYFHLGDFSSGYFRNKMIGTDGIDETIDIFIEHGVRALRGNHEDTHLRDKMDFKMSYLSDYAISYIQKLPVRIKARGCLFTHEPLVEKLFMHHATNAEAEIELVIENYNSVNVEFFGHTHYSMIASVAARREAGFLEMIRRPKIGEKYFLAHDRRYIINPGTTIARYIPKGYNLPGIVWKPATYIVYDDKKREIEFKKV